MYLVILAGGMARRRALTGTAAAAPFERDDGGASPLERTLATYGPLVDRGDVVIVTDRRVGQLARSQAPGALIVPEPQPRHTAASIALATVAIDRPAGETMLVVTTDHDVSDAATLRTTIAAIDADDAGGDPSLRPPLATVVVRPESGVEGPSHLRPGLGAATQAGDARLYPVAAVEAHPDARRSRELFESGTTYWHAGAFVWTRDAIRAALERYTPLLTLIEPAYRSEIALQAAYDRLQSLSIDDAVLAGAADDAFLVMAPVEVGWRATDGEPATG
jgi:mannose-1-phosphate guanylyltransferase